MILIEPALNDPATFEDAVTLAGQVAALGHPVAIRDERLPDGLPASQKYAAASLLRPHVAGPVSAIIAIGGQSADDVSLQHLRRIALTDTAPVLVFGRFADRQAILTASARFAYVTGREPVCIDLSRRPDLSAETRACPCFGVSGPVASRAFLPDSVPMLVYLADSDAQQRRAWDSFAYSRTFAPIILTSSSKKTEWLRGGPVGNQIYALGEVSPSDAARMAGIVVVASEIAAEPRVMCLVNNIAASGGLVIDATPSGNLSLSGLPALRGPADPGFLHGFLHDTVLPNLAGLQSEMAASPYRQQVELRQFLADHGVSLPQRPAKKTPPKARARKKSVLFMPTNGVGLGHARRCALIATEMPAATVRPTFAAFPSCGPMIAACGFDWSPLVSKSPLHDDRNANDILNSGRLRSMMAASDAFVFDGGYIFDSVLRNIVRAGVPAAWVRRGLWPSMQDNSVALDRGKAFARVIIPGEAFPELNLRYSDGPANFPVGPVVQRAAENTDAVRAAISQRFGLEFGKLVVSMPGSGVATDMSAQVQTICSTIEKRSDTLNLILAWPGSVVPPVWHMWQRSRVVMTSHASVLAAASDFIISAAGYNSFHEAMYNRIPAIFVPQNAPYLDNQTARAEAAAARSVAVHIEAGRLGALEREISRFLDHGKAADIKGRLSVLDLPPPGNRDAADHILELMP